MDQTSITIPDMQDGSISDEPRSRVRRRAAVACRHCGLRKVRCDVSVTGVPCSNCARDDATCKIMPRKKRKERLRASVSETSRSVDASHEFAPVEEQVYHVSPAQNASHFVRQTPVAPADADHYSSVAGTVIQAASLSNAASPSDRGENVDAYIQAVDPTPPYSGEQQLGLFYFGGRQGLGGFMFDICEGPVAPRNTHYLLPLSKNTRIPPEDEAYLKNLGAFNLPEKDICNALLRCYLRNVHQLLPIIDLGAFLTEYLEHGPEEMSLLLLWSVLFASSNFVDLELLKRAGFRTRKAMKRAIYRRAKALYDCDYEKDKIALIQSVILLGLWYNDTDDRNGAWHWIGIAIGLSQSIGLHRRLRLAVPSYPIPERQEKLYRRIWWTCVVRDRWLSLSKGQPMRIRVADCDVEMPSMSDITDEIEAMDPDVRREFITWDYAASARLWLKLVKISKALGSVLEAHDKVEGTTPGVSDIQDCEKEIEVCARETVEPEYSDPLMRAFASQLQLLHEATILVLFRPYIYKGPPDPDLDVTKLWQQRSLDKARSAAANTTRILEGLLEMNMVKYLKPMTITALIPAMQIHLLDCKSSNALVRRFASQKLQVCMLVMSELRQTYWGADFVFEMFQRAQNRISEESGAVPHHQRPAEPNSGEIEAEGVAVQMMGPGDASNMTMASGGEALDTACDSLNLAHGAHDTEASIYDTDLEDSFQFLLNSNDFANFFLNIV